MWVQRYIKYLKPPNKKCLISGILVFLCKIRRHGRKKTAAKKANVRDNQLAIERTQRIYSLCC